MTQPRLTVGVLGDQETVELFELAGHTARQINGDGDHLDVDMIVLDVPGVPLEVMVDRWLSEVRRGQLVMHTSLEYGVQVLDPLEVQGAIVMAAHRVWKDFWVASAADEVGESVLSLLIPEMGGNLTMIEDAQRPVIMAGKRMLDLVDEARLDAFELLTQAVPAIGLELDEYWTLPGEGQNLQVDVPHLEQMYHTIEDPSIGRLFVELERRQAARRGSSSVELWAMGKNSL
ncbi:hypothetical protein QP994_03245 [Corynebacterium sp. MSK044]|uniref:6PGD fold domain-containing protein n=1 Tax=Corynebacterium sp. MSK044 TaxID=3050195 RepID=UPI00254E31A1|nr:hypothetical protein [Corynebacterium sp. MSK044]MDK8796897.1 hypothetical protein [Corynebacterium sp. MSK044]